MHTQPIASVTPRNRFRNFYGSARCFWEDGRNSGVPVTRQGCFRVAANCHALDPDFFERLYERCFAEREDPLDALHEHIRGLIDSRESS